MGIVQKIKRWWNSLWQKEAQEKFKIETVKSDVMTEALKEWADTYQGKPPWADDDVESFNFAKILCSETARLSALAMGIAVEGSARAEWLNGFMDSYISRMKEEFFEKAAAFGHIIIKPHENGIDYVMPWEFCPTEAQNGKITGGIFFDHYHEADSKWYYTRLEYHRFEQRIPEVYPLYRITNRTFKSASGQNIGEEVDIKTTVWAHMLEDASILNVEKPLFSVFKMPFANNIDMSSPLGVSLFANGMKELKTLDIAWTRLEDEIFDSEKKVFLGDMLIDEPGMPVRNRTAAGGAVDKAGKPLPRYVHIIPGSNSGEEYHEINPMLQTEARISGINHFLDMVGIKCGFSAGQFVLNGRTGHVTATQVEADDRETIQLIKQIRDSFQTATDNLLYALNKYADLYQLAPLGVYETHYDFGDITYNWEEDRARHWQYVQNGKYPLWMYYVKFEGMGEEEAKAVVAEAKAEKQSEQRAGLFGEE